MMPEAQAQLWVWGEKKAAFARQQGSFLDVREELCVCATSLSLSQGGFVSWRIVECHTAPGAGSLQCPGKAAPLAPAPLPQSVSSEDEQVTHPPTAIAPPNLAGAKCST